jgi:hypothetical protein
MASIDDGNQVFDAILTASHISDSFTLIELGVRSRRPSVCSDLTKSMQTPMVFYSPTIVREAPQV